MKSDHVGWMMVHGNVHRKIVGVELALTTRMQHAKRIASECNLIDDDCDCTTHGRGIGRSAINVRPMADPREMYAEGCLVLLTGQGEDSHCLP
ncbi:hypothetical protein [Noviherbaspirillum aerium]|uniref:hypothetical protein n=1 Tax=Noviherbaspirillum aerium TaxID=2588497 RepID=UPI00124EB979|nr:hypothetical protein [Noviherbaspirillum aerium]